MAKKRRAKVSPNKQAYRAQVKRIKSFIRRAEKRGYSFPAWSIPKESTRVTKRAIEALKQLTPERLYREAVYMSKDTGEVISGTERRTQERKESAAKRQRERKERTNKGAPPERATQILYWIESRIADYEAVYTRKQRWGMNGVNLTHWGFDLRDLYRSAIAEVGAEEVARRFEANPDVKEYTDIILLDSRDQTVAAVFSKFVQVLLGGSMTAKQAEMLNEDTDYNEDLDELPY
nr:MAG TPA: hypothetical protein [Caudoviricetes sp.]